jgi:predicted ATP-grasp superfamily ATP-dependent carboligase
MTGGGADRSDHRFVIDPPRLVEPRLVVMLTGWIDASGAAAAAMSALEADTDARPLVHFDDDIYIDYRARRPILEVRTGVSTRLVWSSPELLFGRDSKGSDVLLLSGPEPDTAWHRFTDTVTSLAEELGVRSMTALGAYPFATPHSRPPTVSATSPSKDLISQLGFRANSVDVPAGAVAALEQTMHERGIPAVGVWAQVPHYVAAMSYPAASVALLDALQLVTGITVPARDLRREMVLQRERLDQLVEGNDEHREMVARLERIYDDGELDGVPEAGEGLELRSGDELAAEVERFLREQKG